MSSLELLKKIWYYDKVGVCVLFLLTTLSSFIQATSVVTIAPVIDLIIHPDLQAISHPTQVIIQWMQKFNISVTLLSVMVLFLGMVVFKNLILAGAKTFLYHFNNSFVKHLIYDQYRSYMGAGWSFFVNQKHGVLTNTVVKETQRAGVAGEMVGESFSSGLAIIFYLGLGLYISWKLTAVMLLALVIGMVPFFLLGRYTYRIGRSYTESNNDLLSAVQETLSSAKLILGYGNQKKSLEKFYKIVPNYLTMVLRYIMVREATPLIFEPFSFCIIFAAIFVGIKIFGMNVADLLLLLYAFRSISQHGLNIVSRRNEIKNLLPAFEQIEKLRNEAISLAQPSGHHIFTNIHKQIQMDHVHFNYPSGKEALKGITITIPKGKMIALVGRSGSGKTTLIDTLMGFYVPQRGSFKVDEHLFSDLDITSWRQTIGYIPQDPMLFNTSIKENLLWSNAHASLQEIDRALEMSYSNEFIKDLPLGIDTIVGEHGVRLSGGQRQRLALARAILRKPELLILDEATSALDSHSELLIQESIEELAKTTTIVAIAHRLSTIKRADYIYVLDQGQVIEEGTFDKLINLKGGEFLKTAEIQGVL